MINTAVTNPGGSDHDLRDLQLPRILELGHDDQAAEGPATGLAASAAGVEATSLAAIAQWNGLPAIF